MCQVIHVCDLEHVAKHYHKALVEEAEYVQHMTEEGFDAEDYNYPCDDPMLEDMNDIFNEYFNPNRTISVERSMKYEIARKAEWIDVTTGSEGPRYDPYGFTEVSVTING